MCQHTNRLCHRHTDTAPGTAKVLQEARALSPKRSGRLGPGDGEGLTSLSMLSKSSLHSVYSGMVSDMLGCRCLRQGPGRAASGAPGASSPNICCWCG